MNDDTDSNAAYQEALDYLYDFINLELKRADRYSASKMDTARPRRLLALLGNPHQQFPAIHVAGTKGKGSVAALCAACLRAAGLRVGLYTSPHLQEFRERIRVLTPDDPDGRISKAAFVTQVAAVRPLLARFPGITWFEIVTAVAFAHFAQAQVDVAVVEVGLGGRLDATNVLTPLVAVITSLSLDHTQLLGDTLALIAYEKGGIIKPGVPVVMAQQADEARLRLEELAAERAAPLTQVGQAWQYAPLSQRIHNGYQTFRITHSPDAAFVPQDATFRLALAGRHQLENATLALAALHQVHGRFPNLTLDALREGLATVAWNGRLQIVHSAPGQPTLLVDCAHNADSAARLAYALAHDYAFDAPLAHLWRPGRQNDWQHDADPLSAGGRRHRDLGQPPSLRCAGRIGRAGAGAGLCNAGQPGYGRGADPGLCSGRPRRPHLRHRFDYCRWRFA
jgi:dihydrofolate synthase / folylpolyglutamate synthase